MKYFAGIDIGGTNSTLGIINENGEVIETHQFLTRKYETPESFVDDVGDKLIELRNTYALEGVGIGAPNGNYYTGCIEFAPNLPWKGKIALSVLFTQKTNLICKVTNDANAAAVGEMKFGGAVGMKNFILVTLGTGVGSGIVVDGNIVLGHDGFAGELGHTIVLPAGRECGCNRQGCLETYCSAGGIKKTYFEISGKELEPGKKIDYLSELAAQGDKDALATFEITGQILGLALANVSALTSPEAIFLFGGPLHCGEYLVEPIKKYFIKNLLSIYQGKIKILTSWLPMNHAAILGAASLVKEPH
jgi:glucokinase